MAGITLDVAHNQWASRPNDQRFQNLAQLRESVENRRRHSKSRDIDLKNLEVVVHEGELVLNHSILPTAPTHWAFGQICACAKVPASYLRQLTPELAAANLNYSMKKNGDSVKLLTLSDPNGQRNVLQAATGVTYGRVWDADVVDAVERIVHRSRGQFYNPPAYGGGKFGNAPEPSGLYASDHDVFMFMVNGGSRLEAGPRAKLNRGFIVFNSETGAKTLGIMTFLFNECCGNHFIYGAQNVQTVLMRHSSGAPARFDREIMPLLATYCESSAKPVEDSLRRAQVLSLNDVLSVAGEKVLSKAWIATFAKKYDFTVGEVTEAIEYAVREEGQCFSAWDMVQGLTASAREYEHTDTRLRLELKAGKFFENTVGQQS